MVGTVSRPRDFAASSRPWPADELAAFVDQHRRDEAELQDAGRDLRHLLGGMRARVAGIGSSAATARASTALAAHGAWVIGTC
ncbi:hypothetical protein [Roseomonas gilardii]|uniref:hypothetical protein n=1 Tax=Roseomonas gilardii TaxID=257708 RepID=UPI003519F3C4